MAKRAAKEDPTGHNQPGFHDAANCEICSSVVHSDLSDLSENDPPHRDRTPVSPSHYDLGNGLESIDIIYTALGPDEFIGFCKGNMLKYLHRANRKGFDEDLKKAIVYAGWLGEALDGKPPTR